MRHQPEYLPYRQARPPQAKRWLSVGALLASFSGGGMALLSVIHRGGSRPVVWGIVCAIALTGFCWLIRQLHYRISLHHAQYYERLVAQERREWWANHQQTFGLRETVLLGPVGSEAAHWQDMLRREHQVPEQKAEANGRALRLIHSFVSDSDAREQQLARMLAQQWLAQRGNLPFPVLRHCYWLGSEQAWRVFCETVANAFPVHTLPAQPEKWQGEASLSAIAAQIHANDDDNLILVAGCQSLAVTAGSARPAGESAALWLASPDGAVRISRGEVCDAGLAENITDVCQRAMRQSEAEQPPDPCILFTQPQTPELAQCGWNIIQQVQDANWGETGQMEMLVVITLAALFVSHFQQPCGWIARDPLHTLALGIVMPGGTEK